MAWRAILAALAVIAGPTMWALGAERPVPQTTGPLTEAPLDARELAQWDSLWRRWDAFITFVIKRMAMDAESQALRVALLAVLLDTRYDILRALSEDSAMGGDPVRDAFLRTWTRLRPLVRRLAQTLTGEQAQGYLAFLSAAEALQAADRYGALVGLDISSQGMRRLARTLAPHARGDPLSYTLEVDPQLRRAFGFGAAVPLGRGRPARTIAFGWLRSARAAEPSQRATLGRLNAWVPKREELGIYLPLVRDLLRHTAKTIADQRHLERPYRGLYRRLVLATAWQESCWRQYTRRRGRIVPMRSATGSVGLMQVNEKVWRGFYDLQALRHDIAYNARAGGEILLHYLTDYAIRKGEHKRRGGIDNLARATYAVYNGGPAHLSRYRISKTAESLRRIDAAFWNKYLAIKSGTELPVQACFGQPVSTASDGATRTAPVGGRAGSSQGAAAQGPRKADAVPIRGEDWILAQDPRRYTLQLVAARDRAAVLDYMRRHGLAARGAYYRFQRANSTWFAVVWGSFPDRAGAQRAVRDLPQSLRGDAVWARRFETIQQAIRAARP